MSDLVIIILLYVVLILAVFELLFALPLFPPWEFGRIRSKKYKLKMWIFWQCYFGLFVYMLFYHAAVRDADGRFFFVSYSQGAVFYDTDGVKYTLTDEETLTDALGNYRFDTGEVFVNSEGQVVREDPSYYTPTRNRAVMLAGNGEKRYYFNDFRRDLFGRARPPESKGFVISDILISPVTYDNYWFESYELTGVQEMIEKGILAFQIIALLVGFALFLLSAHYESRCRRQGLKVPPPEVEDKMYRLDRVSIILILASLRYGRVAPWCVSSMIEMAMAILLPFGAAYVAAPYIDGGCRVFASDITTSRWDTKSKDDLVPADQYARYSTPDSVRSFRKLLAGVNVCFALIWLLQILAVCCNW